MKTIFFGKKCAVAVPSFKLCAVLLISSLFFYNSPLSAQEDAETPPSRTPAVQTEQAGDYMTKREWRRARRASWKPEDYLPQAGSWGFTINANPFLNLAYIFGFDETNGFVGGQAYLQPLLSVAGKYMITDNLGVRMNVGWLYRFRSQGAYSRDDMAYRADRQSIAQVVDRRNAHNAGASFSAAAEYRIGKRRVQGVVGGGLIYAFNYADVRYTYGNAISPENPSPSFTNFEYSGPSREGFSSTRYLKQFYNAPTHYFGLMGFLGVEWFISPWFSLGAEINVAAVYNWTQKLYYEAEGFNSYTKQQETWRQEVAPRSHGFDFGIGNIGANFNLTFYFNRDKK